MNTVFRVTICLGMVFCLAFQGWAEEEEYFPVPAQDQEAFHAPPSEDEAEIFPADEEEEVQNAPFEEEGEFQSFPSDEAVFEEDLPEEGPFSDSAGEASPFVPGEELSPPTAPQPPLPFSAEQPLPLSEEGVSSEAVLTPGETPPFMSRPSEWEATPPTVMGMPPLPLASVFSDRELVAFKFIEEGKAHFDREEWEFAQEQFERAISIAPFVPYSYYFLGRIAFSRGDLKRALAFLQKAELLFPRTDHAWLGETMSIKGTVYEDLNDYKHARAAYRRSLHFQPANLKVLSALARLPEEEPTLSDAILQ
jgi:tetratricopeptide (TPR) repeat protein